MRANCLTNVLLALNSSVNFIIYFLVGNKFREILARQCGCVSGSRERSRDRIGVRFLQTPDTGVTSVGIDGGSYFGTADRRDGFVWWSRRAGGGRGFAPRSPTTEHGGWRRATIANGLLTVPSGPSRVRSVVEMETYQRTTDASRDVADETITSEQPNNDTILDTNEFHQPLSN